MQVLVADDNPVFQTMLRGMLRKWGYQVIVCSDGGSAWQHLCEDTGSRLAILDWEMPGMDGVEICRRLRSRILDRYVYVLLVSSRAEGDDVIQGMNAGADDYICKPFHAGELHARLRAGERVVELQEQLLASQEALRQQALRDALTGLWNRAAIFDLLRDELARGARSGTPVSVIMADVDRFKDVNDQYGHMAGDALLCHVSERMQSAVRGHDMVGRYGGEEFLIILPNCELHTALSRAERVRRAIGEEPWRVDGFDGSITCSFGVASTESPEVHQTDALVQQADAALYAAKNKGRNRVEGDVFCGQNSVLVV